jgi:hypothetical protein
MKLKLNIQDEQTSRVWDAALRAQTAVEKWPAWKRGEDVLAPAKSNCSADSPTPPKDTDLAKQG